MKNLTKMEAVREMVKEFDAIKTSLIEKAYPYCGEGFEEITRKPIEVGTYVEYCDDEYFLNDSFDLKVVDVKGHLLVLELTNEEDIEEYGKTIEVGRICCEWEDERYFDSWLPVWGWLWMVDNSSKYFILDNLELVSDLGFRIYEDEEEDIYIGIDGAGYDFYEAHWLPLYDAMGLQWHK